jgi:hypothetical protein
VLRVTLPPRTPEELAREPIVVLRVPDQGGFAAPASGLPRGLLFLKLEASERSDAAIETDFAPKKKSKRPSRRTRPPAAQLSEQGSPESQRRKRQLAVAYVSIAVALSWIALALAYSVTLPR